jgi:hypothetical protein
LAGLPALLEAEALPVHLQDMVGEAVEEGTLPETIDDDLERD